MDFLRAQVSTELLLFLGGMLIITIPLILGLYVLSKTYVEDMAIEQGRVMTDYLARKIYEVDSKPKAKEVVTLLLPEGVNRISIRYFETLPASAPRTLLVITEIGQANMRKEIVATTIGKLPEGINEIVIQKPGSGRKYFLIENLGSRINVTQLYG